MLIIQLRSLSFYAYHGVYQEEKQLGAEYEVDVSVHHQEKKIPVLHLSETINYVSVYELVKKHMNEPRHLLETVATTLAQDVFDTFAEVEKLSITIVKKKPPIAAFQGSVAVTYKAKREE